MNQLKYYGVVLLLLVLAGCSTDSETNLVKNPDRDAALAKAQEVMTEFAESQKSYPFYNRYAGISMQNALGKKSSVQFLSKNADYGYNNMLVEIATGRSNYVCDETQFDTYVGEVIADWTNQEFSTFVSWYYLVFDYHYLFDNGEGGTEYYGADGDYTNIVNRTFNSLEKFWDPSEDILLFAAHGSYFNDTALIIDLFEVYRDYGFINPATTDAQIADLAVSIQTAFGSDGFWDYTHPLLTFNAFAAPENDYFGIANKIIMGDGIQQAYDDFGYSDVASQAILAHEYSHQVQFDEGVEFANSPEGTRETELMADALAAYYLTHKRGGTLNWKRVQEFLGVFFEIGDCSFSSTNHHGTPAQRMRAAKFGYDVAVATQKKGQIMSAEDFIDEFYDNFEDILEDE